MILNNSKILFLLSEVHNYHISLLEEIVSAYNYEVVVVYKDKNNRTPYKPPTLQGVSFEGKSQFNSYRDFKEFIMKVNPVLVRTSGWVDKDYLRVSKIFKNKGIVTVVVSDTQWKNTFRQTLGTMVYGSHIRSCFSKMMVAGPYQFEYARKLGFSKKDILFSNLSANTKIYNNNELKVAFEKKIIYVGNLEKVKGTHLLLEAWSSLKDKKEWKLELIGTGTLFKSVDLPDVIYRGYLNSDEIRPAIESSAFFVLPSMSEQWGVVMHEACLTGVPILCSDEVGSIPLFLIKGYNGFTFKTNDVQDLKKHLQKMINLREEELIRMRANSLCISKRITTPISAASLIAALY